MYPALVLHQPLEQTAVNYHSLKYGIDKVNDKWSLKVYRRSYIMQTKKFKTQILMSRTYD